MTSYKTIEAYNNYLVENQININIIEYFLSWELVSKKEYCIHHDMPWKIWCYKIK